MNMVMYDCGHIIRDAHVLNFLKFTVKELHHIQYVWTKIANALNHMNLKINLNLNSQVIGWKITEALD